MAMGNVEEDLIRINRGFAEHGVHGEQWDCTTGRGYVAEHHGEYHHCIHVLKHTLLLLISETFGGINHEALRYLRTLAVKAGKAGCPDRTKYDTRARKLSWASSSTTRGGCRRRPSSRRCTHWVGSACVTTHVT